VQSNGNKLFGLGRIELTPKIKIKLEKKRKIQRKEKEREMALNPQLFQNGMPVPFENELFVLARDGVDFEVDKIPGFVFFSFLLSSPLIFFFNNKQYNLQFLQLRAKLLIFYGSANHQLCF
jgi:hypothetical protein